MFVITFSIHQCQISKNQRSNCNNKMNHFLISSEKKFESYLKKLYTIWPWSRSNFINLTCQILQNLVTVKNFGFLVYSNEFKFHSQHRKKEIIICFIGTHFPWCFCQLHSNHCLVEQATSMVFSWMEIRKNCLSIVNSVLGLLSLYTHYINCSCCFLLFC